MKKLVSVNDYNINDDNPKGFLLLEGVKDMNLFLGYIDGRFLNEEKRVDDLIKKKDGDMLSHLWLNSPISAITSRMAFVADFSTYIKTSTYKDLYKKMIKESIDKHGYAMINSVGGMYPYEAYEEKDWIMVENNSDYKIFETLNCRYAKNSHILILENDPKLEKYIYKNFKYNSYSHIINLRDVLDSNEYEKFICAHNFKTIFVYTTGYDLNQIRDYVLRAIFCGVKSFEFVISKNNENAHNGCDKISNFLNNLESNINNTTNAGITIKYELEE